MLIWILETASRNTPDPDIIPQLQAALGVLCLLLLAACFSTNLRAVNWRTVGLGLLLQLALALFILKFQLPDTSDPANPNKTWRPGYQIFETAGQAVGKFIDLTDEGSKLVFGVLVNRQKLAEVFGGNNAFIFAFAGLPTIIFVSSFFTVLYFFGILQWVVRVLARAMMYLLGTSGAETLSATANVFMGQTEAPLIIKPYLQRMTHSELLAVMVGGMATISGGMMAVYIGLGADPVAILATSVMAAPCSLYLSKLILPETGVPVTSGRADIPDASPHRDVIDAAAAGASDGMLLAINVAAMLIAFLALLALVNLGLGYVYTGQSLWLTLLAQVLQGAWGWLAASLVALWLGWLAVRRLVDWQSRRWGHSPLRWEGEQRWLLVALAVAYLVALDLLLQFTTVDLNLRVIFSFLFAPLALLMGIQGNEIPILADLLGTKLAANEFIAYLELATTYRGQLSERAHQIATYALTGFANFGSVGIQIGGIGAMIPERRSELAQLGLTALFTGFLVTVINAAIAGMLL